jgi:hypothetical protein
MSKGRRTYTSEFKREAVRLLDSSGRPAARIEEDLVLQPHVRECGMTGAQSGDVGWMSVLVYGGGVCDLPGSSGTCLGGIWTPRPPRFLVSRASRSRCLPGIRRKAWLGP